MSQVDSVPVVLPRRDDVALFWPRTVGRRFQSNLRSTYVVVCYFCLVILDLLQSADSFTQRLGVLHRSVDT